MHWAYFYSSWKTWTSIMLWYVHRLCWWSILTFPDPRSTDAYPIWKKMALFTLPKQAVQMFTLLMITLSGNHRSRMLSTVNSLPMSSYRYQNRINIMGWDTPNLQKSKIPSSVLATPPMTMQINFYPVLRNFLYGWFTTHSMTHVGFIARYILCQMLTFFGIIYYSDCLIGFCSCLTKLRLRKDSAYCLVATLPTPKQKNRVKICLGYRL